MAAVVERRSSAGGQREHVAATVPAPLAAPRLVHRPPAELRLHPAYEQLLPDLPLLANTDTSPVPVSPVVITSSGTIIEGRDQWQAGLATNQPSLLCLEHDVTDEVALAIIIQGHRGQTRLSAFCRVELALRLEPELRARATTRKRAPDPGPSNLTEPEGTDIRRELATLAGVSTGNVTKVKQTLETAGPELLRALRQGTVSIHRGWQWRTLSHASQRRALRSHEQHRSIDQTIHALISRHLPHARTDGGSSSAYDLDIVLAGLSRGVPDTLALVVADVPGMVLAVTRELRDWLASMSSRS